MLTALLHLCPTNNLLSNDILMYVNNILLMLSLWQLIKLNFNYREITFLMPEISRLKIKTSTVIMLVNCNIIVLL